MIYLAAGYDAKGLPLSDCRTRLVALEDLTAIWQDAENGLDWQCLFTLPPWLTSWWSHFGGGQKAQIIAVEDGDRLIGLAPLRLDGSKAAFIGSSDVCDYLDLVTAPGQEQRFVHALFSYLAECGVNEIGLSGIKTETVVWSDALPYARTRGWQLDVAQDDQAFALNLPETWETFMLSLKGKQRHELRRKMRRLHEAGTVRFRLVAGEEEVSAFIEPFIDMFRRSRADKQAFMTAPMAGFFRSLALAFVKHHIFKLGVLEFNARPVAMVLCFDYRSTRYLYNSAYDPRYRKLSVGLMSKVLSIRDGLDQGYACYDLLKGAEVYKRRLGAVPSAIYRIAIGMS